ncbi:hypothetical protein DFH09DRAFT_1312417 [Mycena vulgaris]|nr:hypothetical protein DFH09DRAFT_1312417 [Mycena vulgaris]
MSPHNVELGGEREHPDLAFTKIAQTNVARGDLVEFVAPLLEELVIAPLKMTPSPDVFGNLASLIHALHYKITRLWLITALRADYDVTRLIAVLELLPSLADVCLQPRWPHEAISLGPLYTAMARATPCLPGVQYLTIGGCACINTESLALFHNVQLGPFLPDQLQRFEVLRVAVLDFTMVVDRNAREATINVPFFCAAISGGLWWTPETS